MTAASATIRRSLPAPLTVTIAGLLLIVAVIAVHRPVLTCQALTFDDQEYLTDNDRVRNPSWRGAAQFLTEVLAPATVKGYYQPLAMISLMLDCALGGSPDNLRPFHRTSLILHTANTVLVFLLLFRLFGRPWAAFGAALLFGLHPLTVEPIAWVGDRKTVLASLFALGCLHAYLRFVRTRSRRSYALCFLLLGLALMAKPTTTLLPIGLLVLDFWPLKRLSVRAVVEKTPLFALSCASAIITMISQARTAGVAVPDPTSRTAILLGACHNVVFYLRKIILPLHLSSFYPKPEPMALSHPAVLAGAIGTAVVLAALLLSLRWTRALLSGWLFFFVVIFPTMGGIGFTNVIAADKYAYLPACGLVIVLARAIIAAAGEPTDGRPFRRPALPAAGVLAAAVLLAVGTRHYIAQWQTDERHKFYMLRLAPGSGRLHSDCGMVLDARGDCQQAIAYYTRAIELEPRFAEAYCNRAATYRRIGNYDLAIRDATRAIELNPDYAEAYNNRANAYGMLRQYDAAIRDYTTALRIRPNLAQAYSNRGLAYAAIGDIERAMRDYDRAIELRPDYPGSYFNRAMILSDRGDFRRAVGDLTRFIEMKPDFPEAYRRRAAAYYELKEWDAAWRDVQHCRRLGGEIGDDFLRALRQATSRPD
ncbi:MAG: tetratricopeptide repeat protein [Phycisphaerae bacterium]